MKKFVKLAVCAFVFAFAVSAFAGDGRLVLNQDATLNGTVVKAGEYKVKWDEAGNVSVLKGRTVVATGTGKVAWSKQKNDRNAAVMLRQDDGTRKLIEFQFAGKKEVLQLADGAGNTASGANAN
jgi:hypothetical protein